MKLTPLMEVLAVETLANRLTYYGSKEFAGKWCREFLAAQRPTDRDRVVRWLRNEVIQAKQSRRWQ